MAQIDLDSEQFMTLLTDALRAGPGSPEWHQAVGALRASGAANADEFQMLVRAREDLESGRDYRTVRAGPGFTRKVMDGLEQEEESVGAKKGLPSANLIAFLAIAVIVGVVVVVAVALLRSPGKDDKAVEQLRKIYFINPVAKVDLAHASGSAAVTPLPAEWKIVGEVPLATPKDAPGLTAATTRPSGGADKREYKAGAIVLAEPVSADQPRMLDVTFRANKPTDAVVPQVFVAEAPFDEVKASTGREFAWLMKGGTAQVALADGTVPPGASEKVDGTKSPTVNVKVRFDKETVIVETGEKRLYEGPHKLSANGNRVVGVRFLRKVNDGGDGVWLTGVNVMKP